MKLELTKTLRPWKIFFLWGMAVAMASCLIAVLLPPLGRKKADETQATNNARQIGVALFEFEIEYGRFPDETTIAEVKRQAGSDWALKSEASNDLFKQLIVAGIAQSEEMFYAKMEGTKKADNLVNAEANALARGECGFAYLPAGSATGLDQARPLAVAPLIPGTTRFDPEALEGSAVVLRMDSTAQRYPISEDGRVLVNGRDLFDLSQPYWRGKPSVIKWPDLPSGQLERERERSILLVGVIGGAVSLAVVVFFVRYRRADDAIPDVEI